MPFSVARATDWHPEPDSTVARTVVLCPDLRPMPKLVLVALVLLGDNELDSVACLDGQLGIHRNSRTQALKELKELGLIRAINPSRVELQPLSRGASFLRFHVRPSGATTQLPLAVTRNFKQELADSWNKHRPSGYAAIRKVSDSLAKSVNTHMADLGLKPYEYDDFFAPLKVGVEASDFWSNENWRKTLAAIVGINKPTDRKRSNVYNLFEAGTNGAAKVKQSSDEPEAKVWPASLRLAVNEYMAAQFAFAQAFDMGRAREGHRERVKQAEMQIMTKHGYSPQAFRQRFPQVADDQWPSDLTKNPAVNPPLPTFDDDPQPVRRGA
jgi:hypothetical protein